jgi:hypothetical protein
MIKAAPMSDSGKPSARSALSRGLFRIATLCTATLFWGCQPNEVTSNEYGTWTFTGYVVDGSTKAPLEGSLISYIDKDGATRKDTADEDGAFLIESLPFGERNFKFSFSPAGDSAPAYTNRIVVLSSFNESKSIEGVVANVSMVVPLFPLTGKVSGTLATRLPGSAKTYPAAGVALKLLYQDTAVANSFPVAFSSVSDSSGRFKFTGLPVAPGATILFNNLKIKGTTYALEPFAVNQLFGQGIVDLGALFLTAKDSSDRDIELVKSNVISLDGFGRANVPVDQTLIYVLPAELEPASLAVSVTGGAVPDLRIRSHGDSVFIDPLGNLAYDALITVEITGIDTAGNRVHFIFDGARSFRTEKGFYAVESNTWDRLGITRSDFKPEDTLWVKYSAELDPDIQKIGWSSSAADNDINPTGAQANAKAWIHADTLFVRPDQRLAVEYGETMGFKASVLSKEGKRSDSLDVIGRVVADKYYITWTNTKNELGNMREDFGPMDSVMVVSNSPISEIKGLSQVDGMAVPPDLFLDNVKLRGDTLVYKPSLYLKTDSVYGIDFDVLFADKTFRRNIFPVRWKTASNIQLLSVDNRQDGLYRPFKAIGDSLTVVFSTEIDTNSASSVPFKVNMTDVNGQSVRTQVRWLKDRRTAVIHNVDTLPLADFDASPAYTEDAPNTRAVRSLTFDLITLTGEKVFRFKPANKDIELHTERGLCVIDANVIGSHDRRTAVKRTESPLVNFDRDGAVVLAFNREIDTAAILADTVNAYFQIRSVTDTVETLLSFSPDAKTVTLKPTAVLKSETEYRVWIRQVPGKGIAGAIGINLHGGRFSGGAINNSLLDTAFKTRK